jgi:hypothetical protein
VTAASARRPLLLCLDDLHWVDKGSVGMLRHLARLAARQRLLVVGTFRDAEVSEGHPLADALGAFPRETTFEKLSLKGLGAEGAAELLGALGDQDVEENVGAAWARETAGNPFFIGELVRHLVEEGTLYRGQDGRSTARPLSELSLPDSVRDVVARRVSRLSDNTRSLLAVACAFEGPFRFDVVAGVADLPEGAALDAVDEALVAQALETAGPADTYVFHHALIRHALYDQVSPSRRLRLHRRVAEAMEAAAGSDLGPAPAGEIAAQWHRSAGLPGSDRGVEPALLAADHAQARGGHDEAVRFLRIALDLLPIEDDRRPRLLGGLGIVLAWALAYDEAASVAAEAGDAIAESEGKAAAAEYLADATYVCAVAGGVIGAWALARQGLLYAGARDVNWARLLSFDYERRAAEDPEHPGIPIDDADRRESARILRQAGLDPLAPAPMEAVFDTREEARESSNLMVLCTHVGEFARCLPLSEATAIEAEALGRLARAARGWAMTALCQVATGRLDAAQRSIGRTEALAARLGLPVPHLLYARESMCWARDAGWEGVLAVDGTLARSTEPTLAWATGVFSALAARAAARLGRTEEALSHVARTLRWLEQAPAWTTTFPSIACNSAETLWLLERLDHVEVIERALREKVVAPDFRFFMVDARLGVARLCALTRRHDEAVGWFAEARRVLTEQGALSVLAVCDFDEALMYVRRGAPGDAERAGSLLAAAGRQFEELGMTGWIGRAGELSARLG